MTNSVQHQPRFLGIRLRVANGTIALAAMLVLGVVATQSAEAQTFTVLYAFTGSPDGASPFAGLVRDHAGDLYGTTFYGGSGRCNDGFGDLGCGTVFRLDGTAKETVLYSFTVFTHGAYPYAGLVRDMAGNLYGSTLRGGSSRMGTVFKVSTNGKQTVLHNFAGYPTDGALPYASLVRDTEGNLYGTTLRGGSSHMGTVFMVNKTGKESVLHSFTGFPDGAAPFDGLIRDLAGNLYGTTRAGGSSGGGTVFKVSKTGKESVLYSFIGGTTDGCAPNGTPAMDKEGNLYGTTIDCGSYGMGTVWKVSTTGKETVLHSFVGSPTDGAFPYAGLVRDHAGNLYGTTMGGSGRGTVFKLDRTAKETVLYTFTANTDGAFPYAGLVRDHAGNLYGTTSSFGSSGYGTVFKLTP